MNPECDDRVRLSKSDKNISAGGWRVDHLFEAAHHKNVLFVFPWLSEYRHQPIPAFHIPCTG